MKTNISNISYLLRESVKRNPFKRAVVYPSGTDNKNRIQYSHITFKQLDEDSDKVASGLKNAGIKRGTKTIFMVTPGIEFFTVTFALFKIGAVPVMVDPGMGIKRMLSCLKQSKASAFIGIPKAHILRTLFKKPFSTVETFVTVGKKYFWGGHSYDNFINTDHTPFEIENTDFDEMAAILFTTGSTGPAKGVVYTHGNFISQINNIQSHFKISDDEIDLPTFPLFALFDPALGMTAIIPDMDPTKPAFVNPLKIIEAIHNQGVTNMFASPALLNRVGGFGKENNVKLPSLRRVVSAGAPVSPSNIEQFKVMLSNECEIHTPYGATEAVPILSISSNEILSETKSKSEIGYGNCVGRPIEPVEIKLIGVTDDPIDIWNDNLEVPVGEIGEITVKGPLVTKKYYENEKADLYAKIPNGDSFWHRMGDLGWKDEKNRIWFCGRKNHRVVTEYGDLYSVCCEAVFNNHPLVNRSALVGIGEKGYMRPVICIELKEKKDINLDKCRDDLLYIAKDNELTKKIEDLLFHDSFPVDIRHNSKIFREILAIWADKKLQ
ncbi:MAG: AMP-binding protein [Desulfobacterales bacterium]|nr:AMP-binding protein [Desulfobacterales bacterium]